MNRNRFRKLLFGAVLLTALAVLGFGAKSTPEGTDNDTRLKLPVAKINATTLTLGDVEAVSSRQSPIMRKEFAEETKRLEFLEKLINMELLADEARRRGYDTHSEVASVSKNQLASLMHRQIADSIEDEKPGEEALRKYYDEHIDNYRKPEKVRARHILITNKEKAQQLLTEVLKKKSSQHEFRRLAQENSEDESTRLRGGDLTFFTLPDQRREGDPEVDPKIVDAAFKIKKNGEIFPQLVKTDKGFHVVMRTGHRDKMDLSFEDAKNRLAILVQREMRKDKIEQSINALKDRFKIEVKEENLKYVVIDLSVGPPDPDAKGGLTPREKRDKRKHLVSGNKPPAILNKVKTPTDPAK